jgi:hypothetical protein
MAIFLPRDCLAAQLRSEARSLEAKEAAKPWRLDGFRRTLPILESAYASYWGGGAAGGFNEFGFTDRMKAMIFHN